MPLRFPRRSPLGHRYRPAHGTHRRLGPLAQIRLDQRYTRATGLPFLPALDLLYTRLLEHPAGHALVDAFQTAGRGGSHRGVDPTRGRFRRAGLALILLAMLATGPIPGINPSVLAMNPATGAGAADRTVALLAPSRSLDRSADQTATEEEAGAGQGDGESTDPADSEEPDAAEEAEQSDDSDPVDQDEAAEKEEAAEEAEKTDKKKDKAEVPEPVGGLNKQQMAHAAAIVRAGQDMGLHKRAYVVAIATALQESYLRVLASDKIAESFDYDNDGRGNDHDSVGLFQQRPSMGWGTVEECMDPDSSARAFYQALKRVPGWKGMPITVAAQTVQNSAYPNHYAKHEPLAREIVNALL